MTTFLKNAQKKLTEKYLDLYLYYIKGVEDGPRIEKRMLKFQNKVQKLMDKEGIALVAYKLADGTVSMSFVPEQKWDAQQEVEQQKIIDEMMREKGDEIAASPENHL